MEIVRWEYKIVVKSGMGLDFEKQLKEAGDEGWEAVGIATDSYAGNAYGGKTESITRVLLKRKL